ncbi:hypothetical protein T492DRAFT_181300 [Pavlovales sp. CCMP2436]|nr:hypothetical protein T492DRAFT_181300 [Pavlovales sp. CCMP2436]
MAIPEKRRLGQSVAWLGIDFHVALGVAAVPVAKVLRAQITLSALLSGVPVSFAELHRLCGLLEHCKPITAADRSYFYGMYVLFKREDLRAHPAAIVPVSNMLHNACTRWSTLLASAAGACFAAMLAVKSRMPRPPARAHFTLYSDAANAGTDAPSLGGYAHGYEWFFPLTLEHCKLTMPMLEFCALMGNVLREPRVASSYARAGTVLQGCEGRGPHLHMRAGTVLQGYEGRGPHLHMRAGIVLQGCEVRGLHPQYARWHRTARLRGVCAHTHTQKKKKNPDHTSPWMGIT